MLYLSIVCGLVYNLFRQWLDYASDHYLKVLKQYEGGSFNHCQTNASGIDADGRNIQDLFSHIAKPLKLYFVLMTCLLALIYHLIETIYKCNQIIPNVCTFMNGYIKEDTQERGQVETIPLEDLADDIYIALLNTNNHFNQNDQQNDDQNYVSSISKIGKSKCCSLIGVWNMILCCIGLLHFIVLFYMPAFFYLWETDPGQGGK